MDSAKVHDRRWAILSVLVVSLLVVVLDNTILNVALPTIERTLHASQAQQEWMVDSYTLVFAGLLFTWGVLGDRYGRKRILMLGLALFGAASLLSAYSGSPEMLIATRALMGIGGAAVLPATLSIISNVFEPAERGKAIGIWAGATGIAVAIGPITGGALLQAGFWWGSVFLVNVPVVIAGVIAVGILVPESKDPRPLRLDVPGVLLSIAGLMTFVYGIIKGGQLNDWTSPLVVGTIFGGAAIIALFIWRERSSDHPILDVSLFRKPAFSAASAAITLNFFALFGAMFYLTFYLQFVRDYNPLQAGIRMLPVAIAMAIFAPRSPVFVRRYGAKAVCATGLFLVTSAFLMYQLIGQDTSIWVLEGLLFVQGVGMANVFAPATESIMSTLPRARAGAGSAVNNTVRQVGGALGVAIIGSILSAAYRHGIEGSLTSLPPGAAHAAGESIGATNAVVAQASAQGADLSAVSAAANSAFIDAMHVASIASAAVAFIGVLVVLKWMPTRAPLSVDEPGEAATAATAAGAPAAVRETESALV